MIGIELVKNKYTKEPFDPVHKIHHKIKMNALDEGLMIYPSGGTIDGLSGDHILIAPPFIINNKNIRDIVNKIVSVLGKTIQAEYF